MNADSKQVGGEHYKGSANEIQHWNVVYERQWCYLVGAATKYLWRLGRKGDEAKKLEDVEKAIHYLEKKAEQLRAELGTQILTEIEVFDQASGRPATAMSAGDPTRNYVDQG
jgi:hypothetical protein